MKLIINSVFSVNQLIAIPNLVIFILFWHKIYAERKISPLNNERLQQLCPNEGELCWQKALEGSCFGNSLKAQVLMKKCHCSCNSALHTRIQNCCRTVGEQEMKFCLPLCGYNTTVKEVHNRYTLKVFSAR